MTRPRAYLLEEEELTSAFEELKSFLWLDVQTRAYIISFAIYNGERQRGRIESESRKASDRSEIVRACS